MSITSYRLTSDKPIVDEINITIDEDGTSHFIYDDRLAELMASGEFMIVRASHVEPGPDGKWYADMSPIGSNEILGPFNLRAEALLAEREWLVEKILHSKKG
jgi:hypothetical protein